MANHLFHENNMFSHNPLPCGDYLLYQVGEMYCKKDTNLKEHKQWCFEVTYVVDGIGASGAENLEKMGKNDCFFSFPNESHKMTTDVDEPLRFHFLGFGVLPNTQGEKYLKILSDNISDLNSRVVHSQEIHALIDGVITEIHRKDYLSTNMIGVLISKLLIELIRLYMPTKTEVQSNEIENESMLIFRLIDHIDSNIFTMKNLKELENVFNYSYNYMSAVFAKHMPYSLNSYFRKVKMETAKKMIDSGNSVTAVSEKLNYSSIHTFSRAYKDFYGISPTGDRES